MGKGNFGEKRQTSKVFLSKKKRESLRLRHGWTTSYKLGGIQSFWNITWKTADRFILIRTLLSQPQIIEPFDHFDL